MKEINVVDENFYDRVFRVGNFYVIEVTGQDVSISVRVGLKCHSTINIESMVPFYRSLRTV